MKAEAKEELSSVKKLFKLLGIKYVDTEDRKVIDYVASCIRGFDTGAYQCFGSIGHNEAINASFGCLEVLSQTQAKKVRNGLSGIPFLPVFKIRNGYSCTILFDVDDETLEVNPDSGMVKEYKIPQQPDYMSSLHLAHEHIHFLKDTNYSEYVDSQIFGDVLTIFFEFLMAEKYPNMKNNIYRYRLYSLKEDLKYYDNAVRQMRKSKEDKDLYKVTITRSGQYLNSFYYAVILINMYKVNPSFILQKVNSVLNHEMTTRELLEELNILHLDSKSIYDTEFSLIKKSYKKV